MAARGIDWDEDENWVRFENGDGDGAENQDSEEYGLLEVKNTKRATSGLN